MSSHDDKEARDAKIVRLEALVDIQQEQTKELQRKITELELEKRLSAMKLQDRAMRPAVPTDSLNLALQAELLQLRQDAAAKDKEISRLCALLRNCQSKLTSIKQAFIAINKSYDETTEDLSTAIQDIYNVLEAETAFKELQLRPSSSTADIAPGLPQSSSSAWKPGKSTADTATGPHQPSSSASKPNKAAPDYAQTLRRSAVKLPRYPRAKVPLAQSPLFARPPVTHADLAGKKEAADQARSEPERQKISQKPNRASAHGGSTRGKDARGRGSPRADKGETSRGSKSKRHRPLTTIHYPGSKPTQADSPEKPVESRGMSVKAGVEQPTKKPEVESSVTPATQGGRDTLVNKDKDASSNPTPAPTTRRRWKKDITDVQLAAMQSFGMRIPSETDTDDEQEAESKAVPPPVPATPQSPPPKVAEDRPQPPPSIIHSHSDADHDNVTKALINQAKNSQIQPAIPLEMTEPDRPVQQSEQEPSSNARKRLADEGQLGTSGSSKRLRST